MNEGQVQHVETYPAGGPPLEDAPVGATEIHFEDAVDYDEDGGEIRVGGVVLAYDSADLDLDIIYLSAPLTFPVTVQDIVEVYPPASETVALVADQEGEIEAIVPYPMRPLLPDGPREPGEGESVLIQDDEYGRPTVFDIPTVEPSMDAYFVSNAHELLMENRRRLGEVLTENEDRVTDARDRLGAAEGRLDDAFTEIELKPDKGYVDAAEQQALDAAAAAESLAASKVKTYAQTTAPTAAAVGDLWIDTDDNNQISRWDGSKWVLVRDAGIAQTAAETAAAMNKAQDALNAAEAAQAVADGAIRTFYQADPPWPDGSEQDQNVLGDMWFDTDDGRAYRWNGSAWQVIQDESIAQALAAAQNAQATADGKVTAYYQHAAPVQADEGDLWYDTDDKNKVYYRSGSQWLPVSDTRIEDQAAEIARLRAEASDLAARAENLVVNPSFEQDMEGWTQVSGSGDQVAVVTDVKRTGDKALRLTTGSTKTVRSSPVAVAEGDVYRMTLWSRNAGTAATARLSIGMSSNGGVTFPRTTSATLPGSDLPADDTEWSEVTVDYTVPAGLTHIDIGVTASSASHGTVHIDDASIKDVTAVKRLEHLAADIEARVKTYADQAAAAAEENAKAYALTQTDGLAKTMWSTSLPGNTAMPKGSTWYVLGTSGAEDGKIIGVWEQSWDLPGVWWAPRPIRSEAIDNLDVGRLTAVEGVVNDLVANVFAAKLADIIEANIGNLTVTGDTHLEDLVAQTIAGDTASFMSLTVDQILAGFLQAEWIITESGAIIAGNPDGARVEIRHDGVRVYVVGPNGAPYEAVSMRNGEISFAVIGQDRTRLGGISSTGAVSGSTGTFSKDVKVQGAPLLGQVGGGTIPGWLDNLPRGVIAYEERPYPAANPASTGFELYHLHCTAILLPGRRYRVIARGQFKPNATDSAVTVRIRHASGTSKPPAGSPLVGDGPEGARSTLWCGSASANQRVTPQAEGFITVPTEQVRSFVMTYAGDYGASPLRENSYIFIEDVGPVTPQISTGEDGDNAVLYRSTWTATSTRRYYKSGEAIPGEDGKVETWYWFAAPTDFKNVGILWGGGAVESTDSIEMGKTQAQALNGATIHKSEIFLKNKVWNSDDEGPLALSSLSGTSLPSWKTIDATFWGGTVQSGEGVWVEVPTSWFTNGANRGICIGDKDGAALDGSGVLTSLRSGVFHGLDDAEPPLIRHTYSR